MEDAAVDIEADEVAAHRLGAAFAEAARAFANETAFLDFTRGCIFGLLGRNGAGKTTSIRVLMGLLHLGNGQIVQSISSDGVETLKDLQGNTLPFKPRYNEEDPNKRALQWNYAYLSKNSFERFTRRNYTDSERWIGDAYEGYDASS